jgi:hypothetical protein
MRGLFGSRKKQPEEPTETEAPPEAGPDATTLRAALNEKDVELYPRAVKLLWHFYDPADKGKPEGALKDYPGPISEDIADCVRELEKAQLVEVISSFGDFGVRAKMTKLGLIVLGDQPVPGRLSPVRIVDPATTRVTVYKEVNLGF